MKRRGLLKALMIAPALLLLARLPQFTESRPQDTFYRVRPKISYGTTTTYYPKTGMTAMTVDEYRDGMPS